MWYGAGLQANGTSFRVFLAVNQGWELEKTRKQGERELYLLKGVWS